MVVFQRSASSGLLAPLKQCDMCPVAKQSAAVNSQHMINYRTRNSKGPVIVPAGA